MGTALEVGEVGDFNAGGRGWGWGGGRRSKMRRRGGGPGVCYSRVDSNRSPALIW